MLQASDATLADFRGSRGLQRGPERDPAGHHPVGIHRAYLDAGADCVTTNTFGANLANLGEYGIADRINGTLARPARGSPARSPTSSPPPTGVPRWVLGSIGPGTKLPTLGHVTFRELRDSYYENAAGLLRGGADALIIETCPDLLQAKAAIIGSKRAVAAVGAATRSSSRQLTIETTGTMLLGTEIGAALTALEPLGIDMIGLNCATGPGEMSEHLRYLAAHSPIPISCEPNAGLPELTSDGAYYPLTPDELARRARAVRQRVRPLPGRRLLRHHPRAHRRRWSTGSAPGGQAVAAADPAPPPARARRRVALQRTCRSARTPRSSRSASGPTPTAPRRSARR